MKIMSFNVGIWTRNRKHSDPFYWKDRMKSMKQMLTDINPDVICFQELWYPANKYIPKIYKKVIGTGMEHPIYVKRNIKISKRKFTIFWSMIKINNTNIFSVHGHWNKKLQLRIFKSIDKYFTKHNGAYILGGDFNMGWKKLSSYYPFESARIVTNEPEKDTYIHFHNNNRKGELDHFLYYGCVVKSYNIIDYPGIRISDHFPIIIETGA